MAGRVWSTASWCATTLLLALVAIGLIGCAATGDTAPPPPPPPVQAPHDSRLCVSWRVEGRGLPPSSVTRCFEPFELGAGTALGGSRGGGDAYLSPGIHTVSLSLEARAARGVDDSGASPPPPPPLHLASVSFEPQYDPEGPVSLQLFATAPPPDQPESLDVTVVGAVRATPDAACAAAAQQLQGSSYAWSCEHIVAHARLVRSLMVAAYGGGGGHRDAALDYYELRNASVGGETLRALLAGSSISLSAPAAFGSVQLASVEGETHVEGAARVCNSVISDVLSVDAGAVVPAGAAASCTSLLAPAIADVRVMGKAFLTKYLRPDAEAVSGALFPAIIELRYWAEVHALEEYLLSVGGAVTEGTTAQSVVSLARMLAAVLRTAPRTVCEIGVNGGHSSLLWLLAVPAARVVAFDLGIHRCVVPAARWLTRRFPGRYTLVLGDSLEEVPAFHAAHPDVVCDFWFIDGGHTRRVVAGDATAAAAMSRDGATLIFDDVSADNDNCWGPRTVWEGLVRVGAVEAAGPGETIGGSEPFRMPNDGHAVPGSARGFLEAIGVIRMRHV